MNELGTALNLHIGSPSHFPYMCAHKLQFGGRRRFFVLWINRTYNSVFEFDEKRQ